MRVVFVDHSGELGGGELSLFDAVTHLPHSSRVILFSDGPFRDLLIKAKVSVEVLDAGALSDVRLSGSLSSVLAALPSVYRLQKELRDTCDGEDLIYASSQKGFIIAALAVRATGQRLIWHLRDILTSSHFSSFLARTAVLFANRYATAIIANSAATERAFVQMGGTPSRVSVVHAGISPAPFESVSNQWIDALRRQVATGATFLVGAFGRLCEWKGQHILIEALHLLPDVHALVVGDALFGETHYALRLYEMASDPAVRDRVHFLGFRRDIPALMKAVDVVVHTSVAPEPFGRVLVEGMLAVRPVIATQAGGALEIVRHQTTGLLVPPGDAKALAESISRLRSDPELARSLAIAGNESAKARFSLDAMVRGIDNVIQSVAEQR
jgi:glycosyltransferase involved in cell wall biosynthesis